MSATRRLVVIAVGVIGTVSAVAIGAGSIGPQPRAQDPWLQERPVPAPVDWLARATALEREGFVEGASQAAARAVADGAGRDAALLAAKLAIDRGRLDEAAAWLTPLMIEDPDDARVRYDLGLVAQLQGQTATARAHYEHALAVDPGFHDARHNLVLVLVAQEHRDAARSQLVELGRRVPHDPRLSSLAARVEARP